MHWSFDDAQRNRVYTNAILGVLDCQCTRHRMQTALSHNLHGHPSTCYRLVNHSS